MSFLDNLKKYLNIQYGFIMLIFILIIYIMYNNNNEHIMAQPTYFKTLEDVYKSRIKDKKGLNYNDYIIENHLLLNKPIGIKNRIL